MAVEPQYVCGADTYRLRQQTEIKPERVTGCRLRRAQPSGKKVRNSLLGVVGLLTTGVLISVRRTTWDRLPLGLPMPPWHLGRVHNDSTPTPISVPDFGISGTPGQRFCATNAPAVCL